MKTVFSRWILYIGLVVLFLLHNDFWLWDNPKRVVGLPIGLLYHIGYCIVAAILMMLIINHALPSQFQDEETDE